MGLPPNAERYFAQKHIEAAEKHLAAVEDNLFKEGQEDRRAFEKFYNNLALFSGGTIALSITYLGYLKSVGRPLLHQKLLTASWVSLFVCLLLSLLYVLVNLYYGHQFRQRELAEAKKKKFETELEDIPKLDVVNLQTPQQLAAFRNPRVQAVETCSKNAADHAKKEKRYFRVWVWAGRIGQLGFALGIGLLLWFAISNASQFPRAPENGPKRIWVSYLEKYGDDGQEKDDRFFAEERLQGRISGNPSCMVLTHNRQSADYIADISVVRGIDLYTGGGPQDRVFGAATLSVAKQDGDVVLVDSFFQNLKSKEDIGQQPITEVWEHFCPPVPVRANPSKTP